MIENLKHNKIFYIKENSISGKNCKKLTKNKQ